MQLNNARNTEFLRIFQATSPDFVRFYVFYMIFTDSDQKYVLMVPISRYFYAAFHVPELYRGDKDSSRHNSCFR